MKPCLVLTALLAWTPAYAGGVGATSFDFLSLDVGPRQTAMGGSGAAVADDLFGSVQNPAALGRLWRQEVSLMHAVWLQDVNYQYLGYARPSEDYGTFASSFLNIDYGTIQGYDRGGAQTSSLGAFDRMLTLSYGREVIDNMWAGTNLKYLQEKLDNVSTSVPALDAGILYQPTFAGWPTGANLAFSAKNLGPAAKFESGRSPLPREYVFGASVRPYFEGLTIALDLTHSDDSALTEKIGAEYWIKDSVALRMGYNTAYDLGTGLAFGFAVKVRDVQIDYAFSDYGRLDNAHHIGISYRFGSVAENYYRAGMEFLRAEDYAKAIVEFSKVLSLEPRHSRALLRIKEANEKLQNQLNQLKE